MEKSLEDRICDEMCDVLDDPEVYEDCVENQRDIMLMFIDLDGLKTINDELGHNRGDDLLRDAAKAMAEVYTEDRIFRAGGDEFTVILAGVNGDELLESIKKLRAVSGKYENVSFAIGSCLESDSADVREALKIADMRMYDDKRDYYVRHPEMKKRLS